eukprot:scaffold111_cov252-Pinguiococcus_pyrenoidosus.AAC.13
MGLEDLVYHPSRASGLTRMYRSHRLGSFADVWGGVQLFHGDDVGVVLVHLQLEEPDQSSGSRAVQGLPGGLCWVLGT